MKRFNPFTAFVHLIIILLVIVFTILEESFSYLGKFIKKIRRNYRFVIYGRY
ncbi:MAG: hypothetical protein JST26_05750 [Bacteroidetes bacterium]|nr:hypothetical protein [Bacteroidota bacterium]